MKQDVTGAGVGTESVDLRRGKGSSRRIGRMVWLRPALLVSIIIAALIAAHQFGLGQPLERLRYWLSGFGPWAPVVFTLVYIAGSLAVIPGLLFPLMAGTLFGLVIGIICSSVANTVAAAVAFLVARYLARDSVEKMLRGKKSFHRVEEVTGKKGILVLVIARVQPFLPLNNVFNYAFGLTKMRFKPYIFWSWLGMLPGTILYTAGGDVVFRVLTGGEFSWTLAGVILLSALVLLYLVHWVAGKRRED